MVVRSFIKTVLSIYIAAVLAIIVAAVLVVTNLGTPKDPCKPSASSLPIATIDNLDQTIRSRLWVARTCGDELRFFDPATGAPAQTITVSTKGDVAKRVLVDTADDTLIVSFVGSLMIEVYSRASGKQVLRKAFGGEVTFAGSDLSGVLVVNQGTNAIHQIAVGTGEATWSQSEPRIRALAVHDGVVLRSRLDGQHLELSGYAVASGKNLWTQRLSVGAGIDHPKCTVARGDLFILGGQGVPVAVQTRTGRVVVPERGGLSCPKVDPVGSIAVAAERGDLVGLDLVSGEELWRLAADGREVIGVYQDWVYVSGRQRGNELLAARTGKRVGGWSFAPVEQYDRWVVARAGHPLREVALRTEDVERGRSVT